jgi:hypothetical protein
MNPCSLTNKALRCNKWVLVPDAFASPPGASRTQEVVSEVVDKLRLTPDVVIPAPAPASKRRPAIEHSRCTPV